MGSESKKSLDTPTKILILRHTVNTRGVKLNFLEKLIFFTPLTPFLLKQLSSPRKPKNPCPQSFDISRLRTRSFHPSNSLFPPLFFKKSQ